MHEENEALALRGYELFGKADLSGLRELFVPEALWHTPILAFEPEYKGVEAILGYFARLHELSEGTIKIVIDHTLSDSDRVAVLQRVTATRADRKLDSPMVLVFEIRDGKVVEVTEYAAEPNRLQEFWS